MQVSVEDLSSVKKMLHIEIPEDEITRELDKAYNDLGKKAKLKGFRPGKAPRGVLEQYFKKGVHADVTSRLIQESFLDAVKETDLKIVGNPKIDPPELKPKAPYKYSATVEIRPVMEDIDLKGLTLKKTLYQSSDEEVDAQVHILQKNLAKYEKIEEERALAEGDFALIDYEGFKDGKPFQDLERTKDFMIKIGDATISVGFDEKLIGMKSDETREITVTFPEDYFNKSLANLEITFQVILKEIRKEVLPEIDDAFAKEFGDYATPDELKNAIRNNFNQEYRKRTEQEMSEQILESLLSKTDFEVPDSLLEYELDRIVSDTEKYFAHHKIPMEETGLTKEKLSEQYRDVAERQVKRHLILNKIIEQENLSLSEEEREEGWKEMSETFRKPVEEVKNYYKQNEDKYEGFQQSLLEKKAIRLIIDSSTIEEVVPEIKPASE